MACRFSSQPLRLRQSRQTSDAACPGASGCARRREHATRGHRRRRSASPPRCAKRHHANKPPKAKSRSRFSSRGLRATPSRRLASIPRTRPDSGAGGRCKVVPSRRARTRRVASRVLRSPPECGSRHTSHGAEHGARRTSSGPRRRRTPAVPKRTHRRARGLHKPSTAEQENALAGTRHQNAARRRRCPLRR